MSVGLRCSRTMLALKCLVARSVKGQPILSVSYLQVFKEVRRAVQDETKNQQTPWENTSLSGDFFFKVQR